jgi:2-methylisocitrate lyase-like PEP mutase family enzyme
MADERRRKLRAALNSGKLVVAPGIYDMISARVADRMDFDALYMTGYGVAASHLGLPDAGLATYSDVLSRVAVMADGVRAPLIADADTGYGGLLNVAHTVRGYEKAGAAAMQLEDQEFPKKCGHESGKRCIPAQDMIAKIKVAVEARTDPDFIIIARTDARAQFGIEEAIARGLAYGEAGADVVFVEAPETLAEMQRINVAIAKPTMVNLVEGGKTPILPAFELARVGFSLAIFPAAAFLAAAAAVDSVYRSIKDSGTATATATPLYPFYDMGRLMGFDEVRAFERRHASK